jgi:hypothetical protein
MREARFVKLNEQLFFGFRAEPSDGPFQVQPQHVVNGIAPHASQRIARSNG